LLRYPETFPDPPPDRLNAAERESDEQRRIQTQFEDAADDRAGVLIAGETLHARSRQRTWSVTMPRAAAWPAVRPNTDPATCVCRKLDSAILVMKSAEDRL
jgi:hypothetical protein